MAQTPPTPTPTPTPATAAVLAPPPPTGTGTLTAEAPSPGGFGPAFWVLNSIEMFERLAFFGVRTMAPIYIMQANNPGGLHMSGTEKGFLYLWWAVLQSILPMFTGGIADRYGFKKTMAFAISVNALGYVLMALLHSYWGFFTAIMVLAFGTAFFKPSLQGSLAQNLHKGNSSLGWGIFYWVVNIGGFIAPFITAYIFALDQSFAAWRALFLISAGFTCCNLFLLLLFKDVPSGADKSVGVLDVFIRTITNIFEPRLVTWLLIMSCFWFMMYQLWDLHPNFITDWVDSSMMAKPFNDAPTWLSRLFVGPSDRGPMIQQQVLLNINAFCIILLVIPLSWLVSRMRTLTSMLIGMSVATVGILVSGLTANGWIFGLGVVFFSLGEMLTGPKKNEYLGLIAPPGKKGLYLGYVNIPVGIGAGIGGQLGGTVYELYGEKANLALRYIAEKMPEKLAQPWNGSVDALESAVGVQRTEAFARLCELSGLDASAATRLLWDTYDPQYAVWLPFAAVGVVATIALAIFGQMAKRWKDMNA